MQQRQFAAQVAKRLGMRLIRVRIADRVLPAILSMRMKIIAFHHPLPVPAACIGAGYHLNFAQEELAKKSAANALVDYLQNARRG
jgi:hypothetical protein